MSLETIDYQRLPIHPGDRVLDLGCGEGRHAIAACLYAASEETQSNGEKSAQIVAMDLDPSELQTTRRRFAEFDRCDGRLVLTCGSALELPFADAAFDKIICSEVLEHLCDYGAALREIERVLAPGGSVAISVPRFGPERLCWQLSTAYHEAEGGHVRIFTDRTLRADVERLGFRCYARHHAHGLHSPYWWLRCLFWSKGPEMPLVEAYHRMLVRDLLESPRLTRWLDRVLTPMIGKSLVLYFQRGQAAGG